MLIPATQLRAGMIVQHQSDLWRVMNVVHVTPGNWRGMVQTKLRNLRSGSQTEYRFRSEDKAERITLEQHEMEFLYESDGQYHFMNTESYEQIALACDIIVAAEHARFGLPEPRVGLMAAAGGVHRLPRHVPLKIAMGMMLAARHIPAAEAARIGLVNEVVPAADLLPAAERWAAAILECSPLAVQATKQCAMEGLGKPLAEAMSTPYPVMARLFGSEDAREGPRAFAEKRQPVWRGR